MIFVVYEFPKHTEGVLPPHVTNRLKHWHRKIGYRDKLYVV
uniref:Uncharacterized protein n=1 Tax=Anguilla anguilla TaxID=7936 RepID=A0A0E9P741_ANGAN